MFILRRKRKSSEPEPQRRKSKRLKELTEVKLILKNAELKKKNH